MDTVLTERQRIEKEWHDKKFRPGVDIKDDRQIDRAAKFFWACVGHPRGLTILDFGCGDGWLSVKLAKQGNTLEGFDLSESLIARARQFAADAQVSDRATFREMAAENLDYPHSSFDMVIGTSILHHTDLSITLQRIQQLLKPDGRAIFLEPLNQNIALKIWRFLTPWRRTETERALTSEDLAAIIRLFPTTRFRYFCFTSVFAVALLFVAPRSRAARTINGWLEDLDDWIFAMIPSLGRFAAVTVMDMRK
jgi:2-polyprenyl-3-methyl-5-hydroxy-6-metoxy-1,4-benzoquinol methylase